MTSGLLRVCAAALLAIASLHSQALSAVQGVRLWRAPDHTRLVFDLDGSPAHSLSVIGDPERVIIDLANSRLQGSLQTVDLAATPIQRIRSGLRGGIDLRIVLDLQDSVRPESFLLGPSGDYGNRLVVDLYDNTPRATAAQAAAGEAISSTTTETPVLPAAPVAKGGEPVATQAVPAPAAPGTPLPRPLPAQGRDILIAIDAGHGGEDPGAIGPRRMREKDVVLAIARQLEKRVNQQPGYRATMIRNGDYFVALQGRRNLARKTGADLFVSIHADAFTNARARGGSVYALSQRGATSTSAAFLAQRENGADLIGGVNLGAKDNQVAEVLTDLSMTASLDASLGVGSRVLHSMGRISQLHKPHVEQAGFMVLKSPDMPSILVETGFISNPTEAARLGSADFQRNIARAIFSGISDYFLSSPPPDTEVAINVRNGARASEYVIARGDTLSGIAERYRVSVSEIVKTNGLGSRGGIQAGQRIVIPQS
jgi:N-acetylmuramoyl-L-alanine amidase